MKKRVLGFLLCSVVLFAGGCWVTTGISDGASGGNEHFFFLPPLSFGASPTGTFTGSLEPVVQICELEASGCVLPPIAEYTTTTGPDAERVSVVLEAEHYAVNWHTQHFDVDLSKTYRIRVLFRIQEETLIEKELGYADVKACDGTIPIRFRIEEGFFPIGELTPVERAKISPVLIEQFSSQGATEPVEALVNVFDDQIPLPDMVGAEILRDYRPTLAKAFVRFADQATLASMIHSSNIKYVYENRKWYLTMASWQEDIGQTLIPQSGYDGDGTAVAVLDDGGKELAPDHGRLPNRGVIDLRDPAFGGCTDVGIPSSCRVVAELNPMSADPHIDDHASKVAKRLVLTAPGADIVGYDVCFQRTVEGYEFSEAIQWVLEHKNEYNIVAVSMSFSTDANGSTPAGPFSAEECPKGDDDDFLRLRQAGIMPIAGAGNDGLWQTDNDAFHGIGHPACSPFVVSVGGTNDSRLMWEDSTRGPNLDLLAPACKNGGSCGTSLSAPAAAGAWAILRAALPDLGLDETLELLKTTGRPISDHDHSGLDFPLIQLDRALLTSGLPLVLYDNGVSTHSGGSATGHLIAADDFSLRIAANVSGASVDVSDGPANQNRRWDGTVEWWLFDSHEGLPGSLIASGTGVNVMQRNTVESPLGFRDFTVDFDFGREIALPEGETFWLALHMQADYGRVSVFWDHQGATVAGQARKGGELIGGVPNFVDGQFAGTSQFDKAFRIKAN